MNFSQARTSFSPQHVCCFCSREVGCEGVLLFLFTTKLHLEGPFLKYLDLLYNSSNTVQARHKPTPGLAV